MKKILKEVAIFSIDGEKRSVSFEDGLNIITGDSKTGKSAIIEIVDYCMFSSRSSIPVGKITDFAYLYTLVFEIGDSFIIVGRHASKNGKKVNEAYLDISQDSEEIRDIQFDYFDELALKPIKNDIQTEFEQYLGLSFSQLEVEKDKPSKLSIRDAVSFMFQHQNLIANKHAIFYRFDDINKRRRVIDALPVLLGVVDPQYYDLLKKRQQLIKQIRDEEKQIKRLKKQKEENTSEIREWIEVYYLLIGQNLEKDLPLSSLRVIGQDLPLPPKFIKNQTELFVKIEKLERERENIYAERQNIEESLSNLLVMSDEGLNYAKRLNEIHNYQKYTDDELVDNQCPLCENPVSEINDDIRKLNESKEKLIAELSKVGSFSQDNTRTANRLKERRKKLNYRLRDINKSLSSLKRDSEELPKFEQKREQILYQKGMIEANVKNKVELYKNAEDEKELRRLRSELSKVERSLAKYENINNFVQDTNRFLKSQMDRIAGNLDFEDELKPIDFSFNVEDFSFQHYHKGKIHLYEMGSGANWLACHISIILAFLHLNCSHKKSVIPNFLILDQPSQVYFPRTTDKDKMDGEEQAKYDENLIQVRKIFQVLAEEIDLMEKEYDFKPQIIVLEHANDPAFSEYILRDWKKSNRERERGLI